MHGLRRLSYVSGLVVLAALAQARSARAQFSFAIDPPGSSPGVRPNGFHYSGFGYTAIGPKGPGYYVGLYTPPYDGGGPSPYYEPIFNSVAGTPGGGWDAPTSYTGLNLRPFAWMRQRWAARHGGPR